MSYQSEYLCNECCSLIYINVKTNEECCLNSSCSKYPKLIIVDNSKEVEKIMFGRIEDIKKKVRFFSPKFKEYLFDLREDLFNNIDKGINISFFHALNELILIVSSTSLLGRIDSIQKFDKIVQEFTQIAELENFLDSLQQKVNLMGKISLADKDILTFQLKYFKAFIEQYENYGLINYSRKDKAFKFETIDVQEVDRIPFQIGMEMTPFFKQFFREMVKMKMLLEYNYRLSKFAKREFKKREIAGLVSIFFSCRGKKMVWDEASFTNHLKRNEFTDEEKKLFKNFIFGNKDKFPIGLNYLGKNIFYPFSTLFFAFYFMNSLGEKNIVNECKRDASLRFESEIRNYLKEKGYSVPFDGEIELIKGSYKYDIIAISKIKKEVYLVEVKYCDLPPSGFSGLNLRAIKIEDDDPDSSEVKIAEEHEQRLKEFSSNIRVFEKMVGCSIKDYAIKPIVIMKYTPLLSKNNSIDILSFDQFKESH